jgi:hypothetical protein
MNITLEQFDTAVARARQGGCTRPEMTQAATRDENLAVIHRAVALRSLAGSTTRWLDGVGNEVTEPREVTAMRARFESGDLTTAEMRLLDEFRGGELRVAAPEAISEDVLDHASLAAELEARRRTLEGFARERTIEPRGGILPSRAETRDIDLRMDPPTTASPRFTITQRAKVQILRQLGADEHGGALIGQWLPGGELRVHHATSASFAGTPTSLMLDIAQIDEAGRSAHHYDPAAHNGHYGDWHSHPTTTTGRPSRHDMRAWSRELDRSQRDHYFGLIVTPRWQEYSDGHALSWSRATFHGWAVSKMRGRYVVERARVLDR